MQNVRAQTPLVEPGEPVEVWCSSTHSWSRGFVIHEVGHGGVVIRRRSDGAVLPSVFPPDHVRSPRLTASAWPPPASRTTLG